MAIFSFSARTDHDFKSPDSSGSVQSDNDDVRTNAGGISVSESVTLPVSTSQRQKLNPFGVSKPTSNEVFLSDNDNSLSVSGSEYLPSGKEVEDSTIVFDQWLAATFVDTAPGNKRESEESDKSEQENQWLSGQTESRASTLDDEPTIVAESLSLQSEEMSSVSLRITGAVVTAGGQPVAGLSVRASSKAASGAEAKTNRDGSFILDGLQPGDYQLFVDGGDEYTSAKQMQRAGERGARLVVASIQFKTVMGVVSDYYGAPIVGAIVRGPNGSEPVTTSSDGSFELQVDRRASGALLRFEAPGFISASRHIVGKHWQQKETIDGSIQLEDDGVLMVSGVITDNVEQPVANAYVELKSRNPTYRMGVKTDSQGYFSIANVRAGNMVDLSVKAGNRYRPYHLNRISLQQDSFYNVELQSQSLASLKATLTGSNGIRLSNMSFLVSNLTHRSATKYGSSNNDGVIEVNDINPGSFRLRSVVKSPVVMIEGVTTDSPTEVYVDVGPYVLKGQLLDSEGLPVPEADVRMKHESQMQGIKATTSRQTTSRPDGTFEFGGLGAGVREIVVESQMQMKTTFFADPAEAMSGVVVLR